MERPDLHKLAAKWAALNIGGDGCVGRNPAAWNKQRTVYANAGFPCFPWLHCRNLADVEYLITTGITWNAPAIGLNVEDVAKDKLSLQAVSGLVEDFWVQSYGKPVHMATLPWVQNGQGWHHMAFAVAALEIMPDEQTDIFPGGVYDPVKVGHCISHAFDEGLEKVTLMLKTKGYTAASYGNEFAICHSLYTADDIPPLESDWRKWTPTTPCVRPGDDAQSVLVAEACRDSWAHIIVSNVFKRWQKDNPGEWRKVQTYWTAAGKPVAPSVKTPFGQGLVALTEARRYAEGTHA